MDKVTTYIGANYIISSLGASTAANYNAIESFTTNISNYESDNTPLCLIDREGLDFTGLEEYSFLEQLIIKALGSVISESGVNLKEKRSLLILSTTKGDVDSISNEFERSYLWYTSNVISKYFECANTPLIYSNACISGVGATIIGKRLIEQGKYDNIFVVGVDVVSNFIVTGFNSFKSISKTICRPYDISRDGLTLGEACGALLLTNNRDLSTSKVVVAGGAISDDANHISGPSRTGDGLFFAIRDALSQSGVKADELGFINTHGTATPYNDEMESKALELANLCSVPCNSLKPYLGHTLGASGVIEIILSQEQLINNHIFGVKGYKECGVPYELNLSATHRDIKVNHLLKSASGFGGTNAAVVLSREECCLSKDDSCLANESSCLAKGLEHKDIEIKEVASFVIDSKIVNLEQNIEFSSYIKAEYKKLGSSNLKFFKMDNLSKLGYVASSRLLEGVELDFSKDRVGVVIANSCSSLDTDIKHTKIIESNPAEGASPAVFVYTLANIVAAEMAIRNGFKGELSLFIEENKELSFIEEYSKNLIKSSVCDAVLYGWCNLLGDDYNVELKFIKK